MSDSKTMCCPGFLALGIEWQIITLKSKKSFFFFLKKVSFVDLDKIFKCHVRSNIKL